MMPLVEGSALSVPDFRRRRGDTVETDVAEEDDGAGESKKPPEA